MAESRIQALDVMRGFALAGIYLTNILYFSGVHFAPTNLYESKLLSKFDYVTYFFIVTFVDNIFFVIFCFLFGVGFYLFNNKSNFPSIRERFFIRRLFGLFIIGVAHAIILWYGDILFSYALIGLSFFWLNKQPIQKLAKIILFLLLISSIVIPIIFCILDYFSLLPTVPTNTGAHESVPGITPNDFFNTLSQGSYFSIFALNLRMLYWKILYHIYSGKLVNIMAFFGIGLYIAKTRLGQKKFNTFLFKDKRQLILVALIGLSLSLTHALLKFFVLNQINLNGLAILNNLLSMSSSILLALVYMEIAYKLTAIYPTFSCYVAAYGRLALTNYLLQTVFSLFIFYSFGLALYGTTSITACILIGLGIILLQLLISILWLKHYKYGPVEQLWRMFTYKRQMQIAKV
ncbi:DUF418 domain-containing protein [Legionella gresilensis]|uniref:DUF418 domain-containing protein n=1 Tax=Legionella gresilensis TaxID=91823 RepID=UPI001041AFAE|nr:DUF418 domain-containing protein [Legionella gresilensis]